MNFSYFDYSLIIFLLLFIFYIIYKGLKSKQVFPEFFNAGGELNWIKIGASILGTNLAFGYIMESAGVGFTTGFAFGSLEWTAAFVMIVVALYFVPHFLRIGILTLPEYLEYRFNRTCRIIMAIIFILFQFGLVIPILISNGIFIEYFWGIPKIVSMSFIAIIGGAIIFSGGLRSKVRLDLLVFFLFFLSAFILLVLCMIKIDGIENFINKADGRLAVALPASHDRFPWTSMFVGTIWLLHFHYWGFYQPIAQSVLASSSLSQAQKGLLFVATAKLLTPLLLIVPGIVGYELYASEISSPENALQVVIKNVVPYGMGGIIIIGYLSTMFATYTGYLNSIIVVFTNDLAQHVIPAENKEVQMVKAARLSTLAFVVLSILFAYFMVPDGPLHNFTSFFILFVAPISTAVFLFAIFTRKTPTFAITTVLLAGIPLFFIFKATLPFNDMNISLFTFFVLCAFLYLMRMASPSEAVVMPEKFNVKFERNLSVEIWSIFVLTAACTVYAAML
ncbi:MAG: sodium:solute symporter family transporter [Cytophagaceae bacterium]